jgi:hypothetical protein
MLVVQSGEQARERVERVGDRAAERAGVQVDVGPVQVDLAVDQAAHPRADRRRLPVPHPGVGHDDDITAQPVPTLLQQWAEVRRAALLLALDEESQRDGRRGRAGRLQQRAQPEQVEGHLSLVVGAAAAHQLLATQLRVERRRVPQLLGVDGLDVVVTVDDDGRSVRLLGRPLGEHRGSPGRRPDLDGGKTRPPEGVGQPVGGPLHVGGAVGLGGDRRDAQPADQVGEELVAVCLDEGLDGLVAHAAHPRQGPQTDREISAMEGGYPPMGHAVRRAASSSRDSNRSGRFSAPVRT